MACLEMLKSQKLISMIFKKREVWGGKSVNMELPFIIWIVSKDSLHTKLVRNVLASQVTGMFMKLGGR
jgi:hypothetical protein